MAGPLASTSMKLLSQRVRSMRVLVKAWHAIRRNAETSQTRSTKDEAREFGQDLPKNLRRLQDRLRRGYEFQKAYGATPSKGHGKPGKRPIVVAPLCDRIIQRAVLDVLQSATDLPRIQEVLATPTSIGGIPGRGVETAIHLLDDCASAGYRHVAGSDIRGFFTKIPRTAVITFLRNEIADDVFIDLVAAALTIELSNADKLSPEDLRLFPTGEDGVAQGCPLSALAGNIVLNDFDRRMNDPTRGVTCIRYVDDFIILARRRDSVVKAMEAAKCILRELGMDIYDHAETPNKAFLGLIGERRNVFLGRELVPGSYPPAPAAIERLQRSINELINDGQRAIHKAISGRPLRAADKTFAPTIVAINHAIRGWRGSYRSSNCPDVFLELDRWISRRVRDFERYFQNQAASRKHGARELALGVCQLVESTAG